MLPSAVVTLPDSPFLSPPPRVHVVAAFERPYEHAVAAARTCYSPRGIVTADQVSGVGLSDERAAQRAEQRDRIAISTFKAGHHTTLQHGHVQFGVEHVSRQVVWSLLHAHPFYNSEQVSQRYVEVSEGHATVPRLAGAAGAIYAACIERQMAEYRELIRLLEPVAAAQYFGVFPARGRHADKWAPQVHKKAQEIARYVLPVATHTYMVHTVSVLTLLRYRRMCGAPDTATEARAVVDAMCEALFELDPLLRRMDVEPVDGAAMAGPAWLRAHPQGDSTARTLRAAFDASLGGRLSLLVDRFGSNETRVADAVREVLGVGPAALPDAEAVALALDPARNPLLGEPLNTTTLDPLGRCLHAAHYAFRKRLSHAADSQDQRHRMTPAARPSLHAYLSDEPDYYVPRLVVAAGGAAHDVYCVSMERTWQAIAALRGLGVADEWCGYLLPNAVHVRYTETADLAALRHKLAMRLCFNAQEEIWQASVDETAQIAAVEPTIGLLLLPPCGVRHRAGLRPYCPEGDRYCGVPVWTQPMANWARVL